MGDPYQAYFINELVEIVYQLIKLTMTGKLDQTPWSKQISGAYKYGLVRVAIKVKMFTKVLGLILIVVFQCSPTEANLNKLNDVCTNFPSDMVRDVLREYFKVVFSYQAGKKYSKSCFQNVSEVAVFPMYAEWFNCLLRPNLWQESLSYTVYRSLNRCMTLQ